MNDDELIALAEQSGADMWRIAELGIEPVGVEFTWSQFKAFCAELEALIRADQREKDAKACDSKVAAEYATGKVDHNEQAWTACCAAVIRAGTPT